MPRADHETSRQHREYLRRILDELKMKPTPLAKAAGVSASSLVRLLKEDSTGTLHARTLSKLEKYSGIPFSGGDTPAPSGPRGLAEDAVPFDAESADPAVAAAIKALVGSRQGVDSCTIVGRALECLGYLPGDTVIVELGRPPEPGDVVWAQVDTEMVMRIYEPPILATATLDRQLRRPLTLDTRVNIKGVVLPHRLRSATPTSLIG